MWKNIHDTSMVCGNDTNRITYVKERFFHSFKLFDRVEMSERQTKTERRKKLWKRTRKKVYWLEAYSLQCLQYGQFWFWLWMCSHLVKTEEGLFRGLFPRMLNSRRFWKVTGICSLLFGFWHIVGPVRNYIDGQSSFQGMITAAVITVIMGMKYFVLNANSLEF